MTNFLTDLWEADRGMFWVWVIVVSVGLGLSAFIIIGEFVMGWDIDPEWTRLEKQRELNEKTEYLCERFSCP